ncbi:glycan-binding surface protein [Mucilaginibacter sp. X5P1]|uniref:glycan-binding surface protein n=1 Tax=Mucilaginibacter sp. X5P1 TaxID=2723088 RepID=UPI00160C000B|nr:glycan-binding surface protein [Mucilaginibacter sp. X5P1]MBB6141749.1 hypothetical protein [Mucilaginibacter sp. X5P1]
MKKKSLIGSCLLALFLAMVALFPACKKNNEGAPSISDVRQYVASPGDTVLSTGNPNTSPNLYGNGGNYVVIQGINLQNATEIDFDGVAANFNPALISSNNAVVPIPTINYTTIDAAKLYSITYKTKAGSTTFLFKLGPLPPTISAISNVFANPGDSVYLYGKNLVLVQQFVYGGTKILSFNSSPDGTALGFLMPAATPSSQIIVTTKSGTALDTIRATPTITGISNEDAAPGDSVYITGTYFQSSQSLVFGGTTITSFKVSKDLKTIAFVMPALTSSQNGGPLSITTKFGTATTVFNVEDFVDGVFQNWDNVNTYPWGLSNTSNSDFPGNTGWYGELYNTQSGGQPLGPYNSSWYNGGQGINMGGSQWVPTANISSSPANYAVKFELYVPKSTPWLYGDIYVAENYSFTYISRYTPWINKAGTITPYYTDGWQTVTLPLSSFATNNGKGTPVPSISALLGSSGNTGMNIWFLNDSSVTVKSYSLAIDNIRVVKIK